MGDTIRNGDILVAYETIKAVSQITLPFDARVVEVNDVLWDTPGVINEDPYNTWLVRVTGSLSGCMQVGEAARYFRELIEQERSRYSGY